MMTALVASPVLQPNGQPFTRRVPQRRERDVLGTYDAARSSTEFQNYWANSDRYDADSAHSREVRHTLVSRARYELANNGFADGIARTYATDLVGVGPTLRMQTGSEGFNRLVENTWAAWARAIQFRRKLWCMAHAKYGDGEAFGVLRLNRRVSHPVPLDITLHETEQCQTGWIPYEDPFYIDGIKFDEFGEPVWYDLLRYHPGAANGGVQFQKSEQIPAGRMLHWFKLRRPGQHRGVPEMASTLNTGAAARRWREATLAAAETAADFAVLLKTQLVPETEEWEGVAALSQLELTKRMMTVMPDGYDPVQMKAEHPTATYESFHRSLINEQARPISMPYNKAACDSSSYNYASGRLDHQTYYADLDVDRYDCDDAVMDVAFGLWFDLAVEIFGWLGGDSTAVSPAAKAHAWDWPKHRVADVKQEADANSTRLTSGQIGLNRLYSEAGLDLNDEVAAMAQVFGVGEDEIRRRLLDITLPALAAPQPGPPAAEEEDGVNAALRNRIARLESINGNGTRNGAHHDN